MCRHYTILLLRVAVSQSKYFFTVIISGFSMIDNMKKTKNDEKRKIAQYEKTLIKITYIMFMFETLN